MTNPLQVLEKALKEINPNCDAWFSHDTYISWADLMKAIRMCLDTDDDTTATKSIEVIGYAAGWDDGYAEGHAEGYREAALRFAEPQPKTETETKTAT